MSVKPAFDKATGDIGDRMTPQHVEAMFAIADKELTRVARIHADGLQFDNHGV